MKNKSDAIVASLTVLCSLALLAGLFIAISGNPWQKPHLRFSVDFADVTGIGRNSPVFYAGDKVGIIDSIEHLAPKDRLKPDSTIRMHVSILKKTPIAANVRIVISSESILGEKHLALTRVNDEGGLLADGTRLSSASTGSMLEMFLPGGDQIVTNLKEITESLRAIMAPLSKDEPSKKITSVLGNLEDFTKELKKVFSGDAGKPGLGVKFNDVADKLKSATARLDGTVESIETSIKGPAGKPEKGITARASATLENLEKFSNELNQTLSGSNGKPGLHARLDDIANDIHAVFAGPKGEPEEALQKRLSAVMSKTDKVMEEMNALIVWGQYVTGTLAGKPNRLIFGSQENEVPTKEQIIEHLRRSKEPYPVEIKEEAAGSKRGGVTPPPADPEAEAVKKKGIFKFKSRP